MPTLDKYQPESSLLLPEEAWRSIEVTLGLDEPDLDLRRRIERYLIMNFVGPAALPVPVNAVRKSLKSLRKEITQFRRIFEISGDSSDDEWAQLCALQLAQNRVEREALVSRLSELIGNVDEALNLVKRETRPKDDRYENLILALAHTYRNVTGDKPTVVYNAGNYNPKADADPPYSGGFFKFVSAVLDAIGDDMAQTHNNQALGKRISRTLQLWRKTVAG